MGQAGVIPVSHLVGANKLGRLDGASKHHRPIGDGVSKRHHRTGVSNNRAGMVKRAAMVSRPSALGGR